MWVERAIVTGEGRAVLGHRAMAVYTTSLQCWQGNQMGAGTGVIVLCNLLKVCCCLSRHVGRTNDGLGDGELKAVVWRRHSASTLQAEWTKLHKHSSPIHPQVHVQPTLSDQDAQET